MQHLNIWPWAYTASVTIKIYSICKPSGCGFLYTASMTNLVNIMFMPRVMFIHYIDIHHCTVYSVQPLCRLRLMVYTASVLMQMLINSFCTTILGMQLLCQGNHWYTASDYWTIGIQLLTLGPLAYSF